MEREILVINQCGEEYVVRFTIPSSIINDEQAVWHYTCNWIDENLRGIKEWKF